METTIIIQNLKCEGCTSTIAKKLSALHGIHDVKVNLNRSEVAFDYDGELNLLDAKETLKIIGYPEIGTENSWSTKAKSYLSCAFGKMG
jgi:copper chaperone CopZ